LAHDVDAGKGPVIKNLRWVKNPPKTKKKKRVRGTKSRAETTGMGVWPNLNRKG